MRRTIVAAFFAMLLNAACGGAESTENQSDDQASGALGAVEAINGIATPPVPTAIIHDARDAAAAANAHVEAVDSILGSQ
jgi:hypothetical protein